MIVHEIWTNINPSKKMKAKKRLLNEVLIDNTRQKFKNAIPKGYNELIKKCLNADPDERPTFDDFVSYIKINSDLIDDNVCKKSVQGYIEFFHSQSIEKIKIKVIESILLYRKKKF